MQKENRPGLSATATEFVPGASRFLYRKWVVGSKILKEQCQALLSGSASDGLQQSLLRISEPRPGKNGAWNQGLSPKATEYVPSGPLEGAKLRSKN